MPRFLKQFLLAPYSFGAAIAVVALLLTLVLAQRISHRCGTTLHLDPLSWGLLGIEVVLVSFMTAAHCQIRHLVTVDEARQQEQEQLQRREARYRSLVEASASIVWDTTAAGEFVGEQPGWSAFTGQSFDAYRGWGWLRAIHPDDRAATAQAWSTALTSRSLYQVEYRLRQANGDYCDMSVRAVPVLNADGSVREWVGAHTDISAAKRSDRDRQQTQEVLEETNLTLQALIRSCPLGITVFSLDGIVKLWNPAAEQIFGWSESEVLGQFIRCVPANRREEFLTNLDLIRQGRSLAGVETRRQTQSGELVDVEIWAAPLRDARGNISCMSIIADVSERKQVEAERLHLLEREQAARAETEVAREQLRQALLDEQQARAEAEAANRLKDEFLTTLSHELRTPLNAMMGWSQMLITRRLNEVTAARALETIDRNTRSLSHLIEDLLDVSRIITGKLRLNLRPLDLNTMIEAAVVAIEPTAQAKSIDLVWDRPPATSRVVADSERLKQIVWNLLSNAVKFTPEGGRVEVRLAEELSAQAAWALITVTDTGKGIPANFLPYVFDRFRQADSSTTRSQGGLGLGMAIVRHLVEMHGGTVDVYSAGEGQGATFTVRLPLINRCDAPEQNGRSMLTPYRTIDANGR